MLSSRICLLLFCVFIGSQCTSLHADEKEEMHPIVVGGNMLFDSVTAKRFYVKGMTYGYEVENTYKKYWKQAIDNIAAVKGTNTVRIYNVNPAIDVDGFPKVNTNYDEFMQYMQSQGLYVLVPLTPPGFAPWGNCPLNREGLPPLNSTATCYPSCLLSYAQSVINVFSKYTNTLSFIIGNEVMNGDNTWGAAPCVKAFARDVKAYMNSCRSSMRPIPLTYSSADTPGSTPPHSPDVMDALKAQYLSCDGSASIDIYGLNLYRWCSDQDTFEKVYQKLQDELESLSIPVIMTEMDCTDFYYHINGTTTKGQRDWKVMTTLLGPNMSEVFSGGTAYSYGSEGGSSFAFYLGGGSDFKGSPGYNKSCGFPDNVCAVDLFATALAAAECPDNTPVGANLCIWTPTGYNRTTPTCPSDDVLPKGIGAVPPTRQGAPGYIAVSCPAHTLSPTESNIINCSPYSPDTPTNGDDTDFFSSTTFKIIAGVAGGLVVLGGLLVCYRKQRKERDEYTAM